MVADKKLKKYMPSNPKGYAQWFDDISSMMPTITITKRMFESRDSSFGMEKSATISNIPEHNLNKPLLKRFIQIFKRHRDVMFEGKNDAPISIIITTLATHSYLYCIERFSYDNEYDLMKDVLKYMKSFIKTKDGLYWIENPTVTDENFAEKWNEESSKKVNFDNWNNSCIKFFEKFHPNMGQDVLLDSIQEGFGSNPAQVIREEYVKSLDSNRKLGLIPTTITGISSSVKAKKNTFFGK